jgi:hypothetical protein
MVICAAADVAFVLSVLLSTSVRSLSGRHRWRRRAGSSSSRTPPGGSRSSSRCAQSVVMPVVWPEGVLLTLPAAARVCGAAAAAAGAGRRGGCWLPAAQRRHPVLLRRVTAAAAAGGGRAFDGTAIYAPALPSRPEKTPGTEAGQWTRAERRLGRAGNVRGRIVGQATAAVHTNKAACIVRVSSRGARPDTTTAHRRGGRRCQGVAVRAWAADRLPAPLPASQPVTHTTLLHHTAVAVVVVVVVAVACRSSPLPETAQKRRRHHRRWAWNA